MASIIQIRRDTAANWTSANPTLAQGELGLETDTLKLKAGDGSTAWTSASYLIDTGDYVTSTFSGDVAITGSLAGDNIKLDGNAISSTDTNGNIQLFPNGTGFTELYGNTNAGAIRFNCEVNSHGVTLQGPPHSAGATYSLELPDADGSAGQFLNTDGSGKLAFSSSVPGTSSEIGFREIPPVGTKTTAYTLATSDVGKYVQVGTSGSITIPNATFSEGDVIVLFNNTSGDITVTCTITTAYIAGDNTDVASVTLATRGVCNILFISGTVAVLTGSIS